MPGTQAENSGKPYMSIFEGRLMMGAHEDTPGAVKRTKSSGKIVWEIPYKSWKGIVRGWEIKEFEYEGKKIKSLNVDFDDVKLSLSGKMMGEFIKKFAGADPTKEIELSPYPDFVGKDGTQKKSGLTVMQDGKRLYSHFTDVKDGVYTMKNGYPVAPAAWGDMTDAQKKIYNIQTDEFLEAYVKLNPIKAVVPEEEEPTIIFDEPEEEKPKVEDVPF